MKFIIVYTKKSGLFVSLKAMKFKCRDMHIFSLDLPAITCDVTCDLEREGAVCHLCNWIRFKRQLN